MMDNKPARKLRARRCAALRTDKESCSSSSQHSALLKRKANPDKTDRKRRRVSEMAETCGRNKEGIVTRRKRKVMDDGEGPSQQKGKMRKLDPLKHKDSAISSVDNETSTDLLKGCSALVGDVSKTRVKRKADVEIERPSKKSKNSLDPQGKTPADVQRAQFEAKYRQEKHLEEGGYGSVFAGYRIADNLPVAIKHIPQGKVFGKETDQNGRSLSAEVAVMLKLSEGSAESVGTSVSVSLLDWYDLDQELILVLERPVPCEDLFTYVMCNRGPLPEEEAKIILKQLVHGVTQLHNNHIFHRDIKIENILIETGSEVPRARLIDFGVSCFFKTGSVYRVFHGTPDHVPPEYISHNEYRAGPTTVWQLGVVLYEMLHCYSRFETIKFLREQHKIDIDLSENCQDFLNMCLNKTPAKRLSLEELHLHPWLR